MRRHREFVLILILAVAMRAMAVLVFRPGGYLGDVRRYYGCCSYDQPGYYPVHLGRVSARIPVVDAGSVLAEFADPALGEPGTWFICC